MSLFGGNIKGKVTAVSRPDLITCDWRAPTWPEGAWTRSPTFEPNLTFSHAFRLLWLVGDEAPAGLELDDFEPPTLGRTCREGGRDSAPFVHLRRRAED